MTGPSSGVDPEKDLDRQALLEAAQINATATKRTGVISSTIAVLAVLAATAIPAFANRGDLDKQIVAASKLANRQFTSQRGEARESYRLEQQQRAYTDLLTANRELYLQEVRLLGRSATAAQPKESARLAVREARNHFLVTADVVIVIGSEAAVQEERAIRHAHECVRQVIVAHSAQRQTGPSPEARALRELYAKTIAPLPDFSLDLAAILRKELGLVTDSPDVDPSVTRVPEKTRDCSHWGEPNG